MTVRWAICITLAGSTFASCASGPGAASSISPTAAATTTSVQATTSTVAVTATTENLTTTTTSGPVFDFLTAATADGWRVINDTVMGGVSSGELAWTDGVLAFTGELSLANGGGFASIRSPDIDPQQAADWAGRTGPRVQAEGDGHTWTVEVRTDDDAGWTSSFPTSPSGLTDVELPWTAFLPVTRFLEPRTTDEPLDPARIVSVAFYLVDGVEGPFRLGIRSVS